MDIFDEFWLFVRKYLFSILLVLAGIMCVVLAVTTNANKDLAQSSYFIYGAIGLFLLGGMSLFFILKEKISRIITVIFSLAFIIGAVFYLALNVITVKKQIKYLEDVKQSELLAKQGLEDIQKLQDAFEKKYDKYATSFEELKTFAKTDSIKVLVRAEGDLPSRKMTVEEGKKLGLRYPAEVWTEEYALALNLIVRDYAKVPVVEDIFSEEEQKKEKREYTFDVDKIEIQRTIESDSASKRFRFSNYLNKKDSTTFVIVTSSPPYGPQKKYDIKNVYKIGSHEELHMKTNW